MRTTIDIPEDLLRQVKATAALRGQPLKELVREALQRLLAERAQQAGAGGGPVVGSQTLGPECRLPLVTGETGAAMRELRGGAQRLLDDEDVSRAADSA